MTKRQRLERGITILVTTATGTTIIGLAGIVLAAVASLLVQSASAGTTDVMEKEASKTTSANTTNNNNNNSNAVLGSLFLTGEDRLTSFNSINKTYTKVSYAGNRTIMPTEGVTTAIIKATETGNLTLKLQSNGITIIEGKSILVTKGGEKATATLVDLNGVRPNDPRSSACVAFFRTNSTGQLAFLDKMIAICQVKASPEGTAIRMWEWKGADLPFGNEAGGVTATIGNQTSTIK
jgi:hypothetical protein